VAVVQLVPVILELDEYLHLADLLFV